MRRPLHYFRLQKSMTKGSVQPRNQRFLALQVKSRGPDQPYTRETSEKVHHRNSRSSSLRSATRSSRSHALSGQQGRLQRLLGILHKQYHLFSAIRSQMSLLQRLVQLRYRFRQQDLELLLKGHSRLATSSKYLLVLLYNRQTIQISTFRQSLISWISAQARTHITVDVPCLQRRLDHSSHLPKGLVGG